MRSNGRSKGGQRAVKARSTREPSNQVTRVTRGERGGRAPDRRATIDRLWALQENLRAEVDGLRPLPHPRGYDMLVLGALNAGFSSADIEHALRVFHADAKRDSRKRRFFDGTLNWRVDQIRQAADRKLEEGGYIERNVV